MSIFLSTLSISNTRYSRMLENLQQNACLELVVLQPLDYGFTNFVNKGPVHYASDHREARLWPVGVEDAPGLVVTGSKKNAPGLVSSGSKNKKNRPST